MNRTWLGKFTDAFRGLREGVRAGTSFRVHALAAVAVMIVAASLRMGASEWCIVLLSIAGVLAAEFFNTALEAMARAITRETDPHIRDALDIAAAAVLTAALESVAVGAVVFGHRLGQVVNLW